MAKMKHGSKRSRFSYHAPSQEALRKRAEGGGGRTSFVKGNIQMFTPKEDSNLVRMLPPTWEGAEHYGYDIYIHYDVGGEGAAYLCPAKMKNKKCPICEEAARTKTDEEYANQLRPGHRVLVWVIDRDKEDEGVKLWSMPMTIDRDLASLAVDKRSGELLLIDNPDEGYDVEFERAGKGMKTKYTGIRIGRKPSSLDNPDALEFIKDNPIPGVLKFFTYDQIKAAFMGTGEDEDEDETEDEDEEEEAPRKKLKSKKPAKDEDEDEEEDEEDDDVEDEDEDEEEEDRPASRKAKKKKPKDEEEDDDDVEDEEEEEEEDEDEDDEDESPRKKKARR